MHSEPPAATPILICGLLAADMVFDMPAIPTQAVKYLANKVSLICGGGGCYAAIAVKRLGGSPSLFARIGKDDFGKFILNTLNTHGIDSANVAAHSDIQTPVSSIALDTHGERQIVNYRSQSPAPCSDVELSFPSKPNAVLVDTRWHEGSIFALQYARMQNIPGVIDAEAPVSKEALHLASHIAFSRQGLSDYAGTDSIKHGLQQAATEFSAWVCVTDGESGTHIKKDVSAPVETIPSYRVEAVDTLGAGDVWHGAFTVQLAKGADELSAVKFANAAAALKCTRTGGGFSAPTLQEVRSFLDAGSE
jgi:sulfofructose kinase